MRGKPLDLSEVRFVKRYLIGNHNPARIKDEAEIAGDLAAMNAELARHRGVLLGREKSFIVFQINEAQVVMQYIVYHAGFRREPGE